MPGSRPSIVVDVPVPVDVEPPGLVVIVHSPVEGRPLSSTLPVATSHVGWVITPIIGAEGVGGWSSIIISSDGSEVHP